MQVHPARQTLPRRRRTLKLQVPECGWDLVVCDEAHKMSATVFGGEIKYTKRYHLGQLLSTLTRHFLLMTATPHKRDNSSLSSTAISRPVASRETVVMPIPRCAQRLNSGSVGRRHRKVALYPVGP